MKFTIVYKNGASIELESDCFGILEQSNIRFLANKLKRQEYSCKYNLPQLEGSWRDQVDTYYGEPHNHEFLELTIGGVGGNTDLCVNSFVDLIKEVFPHQGALVSQIDSETIRIDLHGDLSEVVISTAFLFRNFFGERSVYTFDQLLKCNLDKKQAFLSCFYYIGYTSWKTNKLSFCHNSCEEYGFFCNSLHEDEFKNILLDPIEVGTAKHYWSDGGYQRSSHFNSEEIINQEKRCVSEAGYEVPQISFMFMRDGDDSPTMKNQFNSVEKLATYIKELF